MKPLSIWMIVGVGGAFAALGALVSGIAVGSGNHPFAITPWVAVLFALIAIWLLASGIGVRRLKRKEKTWVTPVAAGRTAIFARSSAPLMSVFSGFLLGVSLVELSRLWAPAMAYSGWTALAAAVAGAAACVCAVIVERWCIDDSGDNEADGAPGPGGHATHGPEPHHTRTAASAGHRSATPEAR